MDLNHYIISYICPTGTWKSQYKGARHGTGALNLFVGLRGTKEELNLPANQMWAFTGTDLCGQTQSFIDRSKEECAKDDIPLLFISFPSAKDPTYNERFPGIYYSNVNTWTIDTYHECPSQRVLNI